ncbi:hypothetical protein NEAUS07_2747, partial [Nematocida ausubeli]
EGTGRMRHLRKYMKINERKSIAGNCH